jgi:transcriptional regulator with XRE-family HTH domain
MPSDDAVAEFARQFALNLRAAIGTNSVREVARLSGVDRTVISFILNGASWPDMVTTVRLEMALGKLWPTVDGKAE